jgi:hypothetical protein
VYKAIIARLQNQDVPTTILNKFFLAFCLPRDNCIPADWDRLLESPMRVTDADLQDMFEIHRSTSSTTQLGNETRYYVRSFMYEVGELEAVLDNLRTDGTVLPNMDKWGEVLEPLSDGDAVFLRYCGMSRAVTAWGRHQHDLKILPATVLGRILRTTTELYPDIVNSANVFEFPMATVSFGAVAEQSVLDIREQALIALFGKDTLLNSQKGGKHLSTQIGRELDDELYTVDMPVVNLLRSKTIPCDSITAEAVAAYASTVQNYANDNPHSTGTARYPFTDTICTAVQFQATPRVTRAGYTPLVIIGHDPTIESFSKSQTLNKTDSFAWKLLASSINTFGSFEESNRKIDSSLAYNLFEEQYLAFIDLFQWTKKSRCDVPTVLAQTRQYMQAVKPLVVTTWGQHVSSIAIANFQHEHGIRDGELPEYVGQPYLSYYSEPGYRNEEDVVIVVPSYHPSAVSYGSLDPDLFIEIFARTMAVVWYTTAEVLRMPTSANKKNELLVIIDKVSAQLAGTSTFREKIEACHLKLLRPINKKIKPRRNTVVPYVWDPSRKHGTGSIKESARAWGSSIEPDPYTKIKADTDAVSPALTIQANRWESGRAELLMIMQCGQAAHRPYSQESKAQASGLWRAHYGPLITNKTSTDEPAFVKWASGLKKGGWYYFEATDGVQQSLEIPNLLAIFAPDHVGIDDSSWVDNISDVDLASENLQLWVSDKGLAKAQTLDELIVRSSTVLSALMFQKASSLRMAYRHLMVTKANTERKEFSDPDENFDGAEVTIVPWKNDDPSCTLILHWADNAGEMQHLEGHSRKRSELCLPPVCMPSHENDTRRLYFVTEGIDIRNGDGLSLRPSTLPCTVPLTQILLMLKSPIKEKFLELWTRHTGLTPEEAIWGAQNKKKQEVGGVGPVYPESAFVGSRKNEPMEVGARGHQIAEAAEKKRINKYLPLQAGDALWLLHKFLQQYYPTGGVLDTSNPKIFPRNESMWPKLQEFIKQPKFQHHPMILNLSSVIETGLSTQNTAGVDTALKIAFQMLRPPADRERKRQYVKELKAQKWKVTYDLGTETPVNVVPRDIEPDLEFEEEEEGIEDDVLVGADGELISTEMPGNVLMKLWVDLY